MPRLLDPTRARLACAAVALVFLPACSLPGFLQVAQPEDGVTVKNLTADLAFGAEEVPADTAAGAPPVQTWDQALADFLAPGFEFDLPEADDGPPPLPPPTPSPTGPCPEAGDGVYPEFSADYYVDKAPLPGRYRWKQEGTVELGVTKLPIRGLTVREVRHVASTTPNVVAAYEIEQQGLTGKEIDTIEIRYSDTGDISSPANGVFLTRLQYQGANVSIDFNPIPAAAPKLLSLPVKTEPLSETSIDAQDNLVLQITGTMDGTTRHRLDACGEVVEAWKFSGKRILQGLPPNENDQIANATYDFYFAPQYGGLIVGDHLVTKGSFGPLQYVSDIKTVIGDLDPNKP